MMPAASDPTCHDIVQVCQLLYTHGLIVGTEGNVSVRIAADRLWITPSGRHKGLLRPEELLLIDLDGRVCQGQGRPSSETPMHLALYRCRPDIGAVVHAHPRVATALTVAGRGLDVSLLPEAVVALCEVPTLPYQMPTTAAFAQDVGAAMRQAEAVLLANHGCVTVGASLMAAFARMETVERVAEIFYLAQSLGRVRRLSPEAVAALHTLKQT